jgi:hypothetical protein
LGGWFLVLASCSTSIFLRLSSSWIVLLPQYLPDHCSVDSIASVIRLVKVWLLPPGLDLADSLPQVIEFLRILCCSISDSCYPKLVVFVASKFNRSLVRISTSFPPWPLSP